MNLEDMTEDELKKFIDKAVKTYFENAVILSVPVYQNVPFPQLLDMLLEENSVN